MKRSALVILCVVALLAVGLLVKAGDVAAYKPGYEINNYIAITVPTIEGEWTTPDEWTDAEERELDGSLTVYFRLKYAWSDSTVYQYILIDFVNDTTNDAEDEFSVYFDAHHDGGTSPQPDDFKIVLVGHSFSGLHVYQGDGAGWTETTDFDWPSDLVIVNGINPSPASSTPHWIAEFRVNSTWLDLLNNYWLRVAAYDASGGGNQVWPDSYGGTPDDWGLTITKFTQIPEFPSLAPLLIMLVALSAIMYYLKKHIPNFKRSTPRIP